MNSLKSLFAGALLLLMSALMLNAQCDGRYASSIFDSVSVTTVTYSDSFNLEMDIYQPIGDTVTNRPLIVFAHGGAFVAGSKINPTMVTLCTEFAQRGYVTASIQYRLAGNIFDLIDSLQAIDIVMKAVGDGKAAIRYMRMQAANGNPYGIDESQIFAGGNSAGGVLFAHAGVIDSLGEVQDYVQAGILANGGLEGNSGNPGYSSKIKAIVSLAGAVHSRYYIDSDDPPIGSCHGTADETVPYLCGDPLTSVTQGLFDIVDLCGGGVMQSRVESVGGVGAFRTYWDDDHVPWEADVNKQSSMIQFVGEFLYQLTDCSGFTELELKSDTIGLSNTTAINEVESSNNDLIKIYPNPSEGNFIIEIDDDLVKSINKIELLNSMGQVVWQSNYDNHSNRIEFSGYDLSSGIYVLHISTDKQENIKRTLFVR